MGEKPVRGRSTLNRRIAIIGMAGRFPGADNVAEFWENLKGGVESFTPFTDEQLLAVPVDERLVSDPDYVKTRPVLSQIRGFDAGFFGYSPREAEMADPQQRVFLECVWEALESAGYGRADNRGRVGIYAGANISMYLHDRFLDPRIAGMIDAHEIVIGNDKDALTTVVAHRLNLTGPAVCVQTFCSTSATAVHLACQSLRLGECEMALAGGVCIRVPDRVGYLYVEGGMASPDGHIRTFDAQARGGVFGDGAGVVVLKPLDRAIADRDTILAVIRGSAINNDGAAKFSFAAPSVSGQATAVSTALADADVSPRDISYVEAHGTATELGDPIEVAALTRAFRAVQRTRSGQELRDRQYCAIGSVKTNVGHLDRAASVTGLIKVVEAMRHELIPRSLHYETPNPEIDFAHSPFYVAGTAVPWPRQPDRPRIASLNGLGMGGTNVHIVVQEAPEPAARTAAERRWHVLPFSAQTEGAAAAYTAALARHLDADGGQDLGDVAYTLQVGRTVFAHRRACVASAGAGAAAALRHDVTSAGLLLGRHDSTNGRPVAFLLAGVGEHYTGMVADLYRTEPTFRRHFDDAHRLLAEHTGLDVRAPLTGRRPAPTEQSIAVLLGRAEAKTRPDPLHDTRVAQPAVFVAEYALARTLMDWGVRPSVVLGYSVGEYVAACLAGVLSLADAVKLVARRAELIAGLPAGALLAVGLPWADLTGRVPDLADRGLDLSVEAPGQVVVGGAGDAVDALAETLRAQDVVSHRVPATHAFHTRMLAPVAEELTAWVRANVTVNPPELPYISNVTGAPATAELVTDAGYWARHMCEPVRFTDGLGAVLGHSDFALLELGPGRSLGVMTRAHEACDRSRWPLVMATLPGAGDDEPDDRTAATALAQLWLAGVDVDWGGYHSGRPSWRPGRVPLPTYPFQREDYWFNEGWNPASLLAQHREAAESSDAYDALPLLDEDRWLHLGVWHQRAPRRTGPDDGGHWVVFTDDGEADAVTDALAARLGDPARLHVVRPGDRFDETTGGYRIRPGNVEDAVELFGTLKRLDRVPSRVVHLWTLSAGPAGEAVHRGLHALVALARAMQEIGVERCDLTVVTAGTCQVTGTDPIVAERATVHGPAVVLPLEYPNTTMRLIDVPARAPVAVSPVLAELLSEPANETVALRGGRRWTPDFEVIEQAAAPVEAHPRPGGAQADPSWDGRIRPHGVYLITGGLGGIGLAIAKRLARDYQARLILVGRTPVPTAQQWEAILSDQAVSEVVRHRVQGLRDLRAAGADFVVVSADVADRTGVRRAFEAGRERFGAVHGVFHAAGVPGVGLMQFKTAADIDRVLAPKVAGTLALAEVLAEAPADFLVLFSSVAAVTGALGQADYAAANAFLDAYAQSGPLPATRVLSVGWGEWTWNGWSSGLDGYEPVVREYYRQHRERFGIDFEAGWRSLLRALAQPEPQVVISTQDFSSVVKGSRDYTIVDIQAAARRGRGAQRHPRPDLSAVFVAARNPTETAIAEVWAEALGLEEVGIFDNFFELGGNSFLGVGIVDAVRRRLALDHLPAHVIYQAPTVAAMAVAAVPPPAPGDSPDDHESEQRAQGRTRHLARRRSILQHAPGGAEDGDPTGRPGQP